MEWNLWMFVILLGIVLFYWWKRPIHWQDSEGTCEPHNRFFETDLWSPRWWFFNETEPGRVLGCGLNLRDWWENERRRWHP